MGLNLIFFGMIFLFHPIINVVDILPDFFGYLLILAGLRKLRDLSPELEDCRRPFIRLAAVSVCRTAVMIALLYGAIGSYLMLFSFAFSLLDMIFAISAFPKLFNGLYFVGSICENTSLIRHSGSLSVLTMVFFSIRTLSATGPDLLLYLFVGDTTVSLLESYRIPLYLVSFAITLAIGVIWLVLMLRVGKNIARDTAFLSAVQERYQTNIAPNTSLFLCRAFASGFSFLIFGAIFFADPYIDGMDCLPDFFTPLFFLFAMICLRRHLSVPRRLYLFALLSAVLGMVAWILQITFSLHYYSAVFIRLPAVMQQLTVTETIICISKGLSLLMLLSLLPLLRQAVHRYACHENTDGLENIADQDNALRRSFSGRYAVVGTAAVIASVLGAIGAYLLYFKPTVPFYCLAVAAVFIALFSMLLNRIRTYIDERQI